MTRVPIHPRQVLERTARELVLLFCEQIPTPSLRVADTQGRAACLILLWDASQPMPLAGAERRQRVGQGRLQCKMDLVEVLRSSGRPLVARDLERALQQAGKTHRSSAVARALADLTAAGELVNARDRKGYRLPDWVRPQRTRGLFD